MTCKHCAFDVKFPKWFSEIVESAKSKAFTKDSVVMKWRLGLLGKKFWCVRMAYLSFTEPRKNLPAHQLFLKMSSTENFIFGIYSQKY